MKHSFKTSFRLALLLFIYLTAHGGLQAQTLPASWKPGMVLTTYYGGGMRNQKDLLRIAADSSFERHTGVDNNKKYVLHFSQAELDGLLTFLKAKHFDKIKNGPPAVINDGWSSDITLQWNNEIISIQTGAAYTIPEAYSKDLSDILLFVNKMVAQKKMKQK